ncbi:hypothetical protein F9N44_23910 [Salmonella enterica]|nr:hypothetical protein [Salmonella enterica]
MLFAKCAPGDIISAARCRVISSGQSHQLSTGTVEKPTSPVGFFTSGFWFELKREPVIPN